MNIKFFMINLLTNKLKGTIINAESEGDTMKLQIMNGDYERLLDDNDNIICEAHKLDAEDVLFALGYKFEIEEVEEDED